ncbi:MAG TPA: mRNA surveillance protein pelota [Thermoplasmata archaeon]|nr:mRNA surveillance protein pelota [Thermoplasmata archaeon]
MYASSVRRTREPCVRLLSRDPVTGLHRLRLETPSDLWRISRLVRPGDIVGASTTRRDPEAPADVPGAERTRRRVHLVIRTEQVEFHGFSGHVRLTGPIVEGPFDIGRHHTLDLAEGDDVTILKPTLGAGDRALLDEGLSGKGEPTIVIAAVDWGDSSVVRIRGRAIEPLADVRRTIAGKQYGTGPVERDREAYLDDLLAVVVREGEAANALVVCGPGFLKEHLSRRLAEKAPALSKRTRVYPTSESGRAGVDELLRSGRASEVLVASVAAEEAEVVEQLVRALATGTRAAVGRREVTEAIEGDAVETVLVSDELLADPEIARLLDRVRSGRGRIFLVRADEAAGKKLTALGGIAAVLRYDWTSLGRTTGSPGSPRAAPRTGASGP